MYDSIHITADLLQKFLPVQILYIDVLNAK